MTIQQLKYFIKICECKKINEAAKDLFISQPCLSNAMMDLEKEFNITLFLRKTTGITLTHEGEEFLSYARGVIEQVNLVDERYLNKKNKQICQISSQHYSFVVLAFSNIVKRLNDKEYEITLRETKTYEIIDDVSNFRSEIGVLYLSEFNQKIILNLLKENDLIYESLYIASPHVFISNKNPLHNLDKIKISDLDNYPCLTFEQGIHNSLFYSEEILNSLKHKKSIKVSDRATLFNLLVGINGYTISSGIIDKEINDKNIISKPLDTFEKIEIIYIVNKKNNLSEFGKAFLEELKKQFDCFK